VLLNNGTSVRRTDPHRHKYPDAMAEYLDHLALDGMHDSTEGDAEASVGWFLQFGKRILRGDNQGFVWVEALPSKAAADDHMDALRGMYAASLWDAAYICQDCLLFHANNDTSGIDDATREAEVRAAVNLDGCDITILGDDMGYRTTPCEACDSNLAGNRYLAQIRDNT
jgi:hypothetical protein